MLGMESGRVSFLWGFGPNFRLTSLALTAVEHFDITNDAFLRFQNMFRVCRVSSHPPTFC